MDLRQRLQRVLQILEDAESNGALCDLERDIVLGELREVYTELKFSDERNECVAKIPVIPANVEPEVAPEPEPEPEPEVEPEDDAEEPEVEVEILFDEEAEEEQNVVETAAEPNEQPNEQPNDESKEQPKEELSSLVSHISSKKSSPLLSLYEDDPAPIVGEQFHEQTSLADTIACPKGVAESAPVASLREAIGVADKFMLIRELFGGDSVAYDSAIDALDRQPSFDDCIIFIAEHYAWSPNSQATKFVMDLLQRKYN